MVIVLSRTLQFAKSATRTLSANRAAKQAEGVLRQRVAAPGDVLIGANKREPALVKCSGLRQRNIDHRQRHAELLRGGFERCGVRRAVADAEQGEITPE